MVNIIEIYEGSNGEATKALYAKLEALGPMGVVAMNLFRAQKCSARAKVYRGGGYRGMAYDRKQWSMDNLCKVLATIQLVWGWKEDPAQPFHKWVLYVELPTGQVSFHTSARGAGPDYPGEWDGQRDASAGRIITFCEQLLSAGSVVAGMESRLSQQPGGTSIGLEHASAACTFSSRSKSSVAPALNN